MPYNSSVSPTASGQHIACNSTLRCLWIQCKVACGHSVTLRADTVLRCLGHSVILSADPPLHCLRTQCYMVCGHSVILPVDTVLRCMRTQCYYACAHSVTLPAATFETRTCRLILRRKSRKKEAEVIPKKIMCCFIMDS
jgi:hypothetical protein